ncbi:MAG: hypothetical protein COB37_02685 [Kordiimonadales bacterium]|nr:MAG: hypothetical protein COB37_02685 [Kordiimonadales bacterium]
MTKTTRISVIYNPSAGNKNTMLLDGALAALSRRAIEVAVHPTRYAGHATEIARVIVEAGSADCILVAGGDGTVREVARGTLGSGTASVILPIGTANVLAQELGYYASGKPSADRIADICLQGAVLQYWPFWVTFEGQDKLGLCWLGAGFDAAVLQLVNPVLKKRMGRVAFVPAVLRTLARERKAANIPWTMSGGQNQNTEAVAGWVILANISRYAGPFCLTKRTSHKQKGMACLMLNKKGAIARLVEQGLLLFKPLDGRAEGQFLLAGSIRVGSKDTPLQLDGDYLGCGEARVRIADETVQFLVPMIQ